ncbi:MULTISPECIES: PIG-L deacetylase family protein [Mycobacteriaceae]|uniref:PIG-L family deacetylase n=1 Tax=Mycolicibacterium parafortuitum TaxID=39692 RepID=A0ACC6MEH9_MYCPF|nr:MULTISPECIES: PIG-L family deacetylase [Mycobacteriaceae]MDZ5085368.1 PIG-L family deacetylase [Mycolicibacterium parafortuitum]GFM17665.1 LmbE-like protein [Mycobacterium sp. PO1]GFM21760.1 LmbE-like protein [Mycobacterium sp. PO2]
MTAAFVSNSARLAARPLTCGGTPTHQWLNAAWDASPLDLSDCPEIVVAGAHPDDETLGFGATASLLAAAGVRVQIVSASDGGAAYASQSVLQRYRLERTRRAELHRAARVLGVAPPICLGLSDGEIAEHEHRLTDLLTEILAAKPPGTWCAATWRGDGHPDHEAVGRAAAVAAGRTGAVLVEYPVWMWHWARPGDDAVPWQRMSTAPVDAAATERKRLAAQSFRSQFLPPTPDDPPVLPPAVLHRLLAVGEVVFR